MIESTGGGTYNELWKTRAASAPNERIAGARRRRSSHTTGSARQPDGARSGQGSPPAPLLFRFTNPMTGNSTETDEKPCPLTVSEWIALLTAESHAIISCKTHLGNTNF